MKETYKTLGIFLIATLIRFACTYKNNVHQFKVYTISIPFLNTRKIQRNEEDLETTVYFRFHHRAL